MSYYFGLDLSTQQLKLLVIDEGFKIVHSYSLEFETDLPHYKTVKGVYSDERTGEIVAPVTMWIEALDVVLEKVKQDGIDFALVKGISGSCQQHGSVYWSDAANDVLSSLDPTRSLKDQIGEACFSLQTSPNWQDHSTGEELEIFERYVGGADSLAEITGSRAHYRFTGPQIRKLLKLRPEVYHKTKRISLVSSFLASLFSGTIVELEEADACGMNLYDIKNKRWDEQLLATCSMTHEMDGIEDETVRQQAIDELKRKLGNPSPAGFKAISKISSYFVQKFGFKEDCRIYSFTGDNLATIISFPLNEDELLISLGTSTTVLLVTKHYVPSSAYHTFIHPTIPDSYMGMICYCNGSLAREKIRDLLNKKFNKPSNDWTLFDKLLSQSKFNKAVGVYFPIGEIVPNCKAQTIRARMGSDGELEIVDSWDEEIDAGVIVQSQALSCRARAAPMLNVKAQTIDGIESLEFDGKLISKEHLSQRPHKVVFVGGASKNTAIVSKFAEVLGGESFRFDNPNACALGGAFKASWSVACEDDGVVDFHRYLESRFDTNTMERIQVDEKQWDTYIPGLKMLQQLETVLER
ncbi:XKS1 [Cyberlindnera jadinii]|uniref:Xylulose kinase n=1 Tax=Cyberlindnera jadinii (strain ATCC 18201 / CBS 1600 / BCRC 20928 / JCM 3617 / NBRC 0987 / NRRL Y-1542) TaxID=983966 RepID=A0A0H5C971_CYBJN|nr:XKS1 [Cyberlindnera jadinii]